MNIVLHVNKEQNEWEITIKGTIGERPEKGLGSYIETRYDYLYGAVALIIERLAEVQKSEKDEDALEATKIAFREMDLPRRDAVAYSGSGQQRSGADRGPTGH